MATSSSESTPVREVSSESRRARDAATDEIFRAYRFDDILPLKLDIVNEEKLKKNTIYTVRVRSGPYAEAEYADFEVHVSMEALLRLVSDLKTVGYSPMNQTIKFRKTSLVGNRATPGLSSVVEGEALRDRAATPSPVPSVNSENASESGASINSELDGLTSLLPAATSWSLQRTFWQDFLHSLCTSLMASTNPSFRYLFFPNLHLTDWHRLAMQHASMVLGSEGIWEVEEPLPGVGWRFAKHYAVIHEITNEDHRLMMSWTFLGRKYSHCEVKERQEALKQLMRLQHPYIYPIIYETFHEAGCLIMHPICASGSLKDRIYKAKPFRAFHKKYTRCHERRPFPLDEVRLYGRQILEALKAIHDCGIPYGHLHARNVVLENNVCRLTDIHNTVIGLPGYYRPYLIQLPKICMFPSIDVYCFGRILYEMTFGEGLDAPCIESIPPECPPEIQPVLNLLITTQACFEKGMPTLKYLLSAPLFQGVDLNMEPPALKLSSKVVGTCRGLAERYEKRLSEAEKTFKQSSLCDGVFFRPVSPVLSRVKKSSSMQVLKNFFVPQTRRSSKLSCFSNVERCGSGPGSVGGDDSASASDAEDMNGAELGRLSITNRVPLTDALVL